jgi:hypothetical protein
MTVALERLLAQGDVYVDPCSVVIWEQADASRPWLPPHLLSVAGLPREAMVRLSKVDFLRLSAASLWLKGLLVSRSAVGGFQLGDSLTAKLALQSVREAAGHGLMLHKMTEIAGLGPLQVMHGASALDAAAAGWTTAGPQLWAWQYLADSVIDSFVLKALREGGDMCPAARQVLQLHHRDHIRHMNAARAMFERTMKTAGPVETRWFAFRLPGLLRHFLRLAFFPTEASLAALSLSQPKNAARSVWNDQSRRSLAAGCAASAVTVLRRGGLPLRPGASYPW